MGNQDSLKALMDWHVSGDTPEDDMFNAALDGFLLAYYKLVRDEHVRISCCGPFGMKTLR